jgi:hypothetical protein
MLLSRVTPGAAIGDGVHVADATAWVYGRSSLRACTGGGGRGIPRQQRNEWEVARTNSRATLRSTLTV